MRMRYMLPAGVTCAHCVLQWWWVTANSCNPPGYRDRTWPTTFAQCSGDGPGAGWWGPSLRDCGDAYPEEFWNCADVSIVSAGPTPPTAAPTPSPTLLPTAPTVARTSSPTQSGAPTQTAAPAVAPAPTPSEPGWYQVSSWPGGCQLTMQLVHTTAGTTWTLELTLGAIPVTVNVRQTPPRPALCTPPFVYEQLPLFDQPRDVISTRKSSRPALT